MDYTEYEPQQKHRKKKNQKSKIKKRSDHKHTYVDVIVEGWLVGFEWAQMCTTCGRIKREGNFSKMFEGLRKDNKLCYSSKGFLTIKEIHEKYPEVKIYVFKRDGNGKIDFSSNIQEVEY